MCMSPLKAIASPQILINWQPRQASSDFKLKQTVTIRSEVGSSPDFKIKKMVGAESFRDQALHNSKCSLSSKCDSQNNFSSEDGDQETSVARLIETSKMRRLQEAKTAWLSTHSSNSPFRFKLETTFDNFESISGFESQPYLSNQKFESCFTEAPGLFKSA